MAAARHASARKWAFSAGIPLVIVSAPLWIAALVEWACDLGRVEPKFFEVSALILPVLALPLFLERGQILVRRIAQEGVTAELKAITVGQAILITGSLLVGEIGALTAVAANRTTTFLTIVCALSLLIQVALLAETTTTRILKEGRDRHGKSRTGVPGSV